jgi:hypothetical protein
MLNEENFISDTRESGSSVDELFREEGNKADESKLRGVLVVRTDRESLSITFGQANKAIRRPRQDKDGGVVKSQGLSVGFADITVREYPMTIGDNPSPMRGPSLSIEWKHQVEHTLSIDDYETMRPDRRTSREMMIPLSTREQILKRAGFARKEIIKLTRPVNIARHQRKSTNATFDLRPLHEVGEKVSRTAINILTLGRRKRNERKLLQPFRSDSCQVLEKRDMSHNTVSTMSAYSL